MLCRANTNTTYFTLFLINFADADGDNVTIFDQLDYEHFLTQNIHKIFVEKLIRAKRSQRSQNVSSTETIPSTSKAKLVHHENVFCDICEKDIYGYRYKCLECKNFDLCMDCEAKSHARHLMIRIANPTKTTGAEEVIENWREISKVKSSDEKTEIIWVVYF